MTRFKKYVRSKGQKLASDYPWLPFEKGNITIEDVYVDCERAIVTTVYNVGVGFTKYDRTGSYEFDFD